MYYVYLIKSIEYPNQTYIGFTKNLRKRLSCHNHGSSIHTSKYRPWKLEAYFSFVDEKKALAFEKYLKSQSGRAFAKKRLW